MHHEAFKFTNDVSTPTHWQMDSEVHSNRLLVSTSPPRESWLGANVSMIFLFIFVFSSGVTLDFAWQANVISIGDSGPVGTATGHMPRHLNLN